MATEMAAEIGELHAIAQDLSSEIQSLKTEVEELRKEIEKIIEVVFNDIAKMDQRLQTLEALPHNVPRGALRW